MISVVIPAYNEEKYIAACLRSLMNQEVKADEIIVVDNNSIDNTAEIAKSFNVKIVREEEQGMIPARNRGFNEAKHKIIAQTDADTILPPDWLKKIKKAFDEDPNLVGLSGRAIYYEVSPLIIFPNFQAKILFALYTFIVKLILGSDCIFGPNKALRKSAWEKIRDTICKDDREVHEDIDLAIHLAKVGKVRFDNSLVVSSSWRRWRRIVSYFEYPYRGFKSIQRHKKINLRDEARSLLKKL